MRVRADFVSPTWDYMVWHALRWPAPKLDVDLVHAPSLAIPPHRVPLVVSIHDLAFLRHPETFTRHGRRFHEHGLAIARREAGAVIVPSAFTRDELVAVGFAPSRIHQVALATTLRPTQPTIDRAPLGGPRYLLVPGTIEPRKGHALIVEAFAQARRRLPDLELVIAGRTGWISTSERDALRQPLVHLVDRPTDAALDRWFRRATLVVNMSRYEGFGLTVLEALGYGCPTIASDIPAHRELAADAAWLVPPDDADALATAIVELIEDRDDVHPPVRVGEAAS